jgi:hypothetical protein
MRMILFPFEQLERYSLITIGDPLSEKYDLFFYTPSSTQIDGKRLPGGIVIYTRGDHYQATDRNEIDYSVSVGSCIFEDYAKFCGYAPIVGRGEYKYANQIRLPFVFLIEKFLSFASINLLAVILAWIGLRFWPEHLLTKENQ